VSVDYAYEIATTWTPQELSQSIAAQFGLTIELRPNHFALFNDDAILWVDEQSELGREILNEHLGLDTTVNVLGQPATHERYDAGLKLIGEIAGLLLREGVGDFAFLVNGESVRLLNQDGELVVHSEDWWIKFWTPILRCAGVWFEIQRLPQL
jgi:hypothetical protein